jgi:NTE family protein
MEITLALGGGGVRGVAHIGVIRTLEKYDFKIRAIAGTSAGGLVGAVYSAGFSTEEIEAAFNEMKDDWSFSRNSEDNPSLLGFSNIAPKLQSLLGDKTFDDLPIPFAATAVSLSSGNEIILRKGKVIDAVMATIAIPGVFPCQEVGGRVLMDGGVLDPVPVEVARWMNPELPVVAVTLHNTPEGWKADETAMPLPIPGPQQIVDRIAKLRPVQAFKIFTRASDVSSHHLTELAMQLYQPEIIISPQVGHIGVLQKIDTAELIEIGCKATETAIQAIKDETNWTKTIQRKVKNRIIPPSVPHYWEIIED